MKVFFKNHIIIIKAAAVFAVTVLVLATLLILTAFIPKDSIRKNMLSSAEYLCEDEPFVYLDDKLYASKIDRYADAILLGIAWQYDSKEPARSVMISAFHHDEHGAENKALREAVLDGTEADQQYLRYWHGSIAVIRPLLTFLDLKQIYILNAVLLSLLLILLLFLLFRYKAYAPAIGLIAGLGMTVSWYVPCSLEYTWTFYIMLIMSIFCTLKMVKGKSTGGMATEEKSTGGMVISFMICGMVTSFMDFLTTELLTLFVPLLIVLWFTLNRSDEYLRAEKPDKKLFKRMISLVIGWGVGYVGMWVMKWIVASLILHENAFAYVKGHISERMGGDLNLGLWDYLTGAVSRNLRSLLPYNAGGLGMAAGIMLVMVLLYFCIIYRKEKPRWKIILIYLLTGMVPVLRFLVMHNHSYLHAFFTFRVLIVSVLSAALAAGEIIDRGLLIHEKKRR